MPTPGKRAKSIAVAWLGSMRSPGASGRSTRAELSRWLVGVPRRAQALGIERSNLYRKMRQLGIPYSVLEHLEKRDELEPLEVG